MSTAAGDRATTFRQTYADSFRHYLDAPGEVGLQHAYELGRLAVAEGLNVLDVAEAHHAVLLDELLRHGTDEVGARIAVAGRDFLSESLSTFEMASRGYRDASETVRLQERHARRLRRLAEAALAVSASLSIEEIARLVTEWSRQVVDADHARCSVVVPGSRTAMAVDAADPTTADDIAIDAALAEAAAESGQPGRRPGDAPGGARLVVPLNRRGEPALGAIQLAAPGAGDFDDDDGAVLVQLASMASVAVENALLYERAHRIAETLQRSLLPEALPGTVAGARVAVRYLAGGEGVDVGGDFYDVIDFGDGRVGLALGDVMGKGVRAAATMGQLRMGLRAFALDGRPPAEVLAALDRLLSDIGGDAFATAVYLLWEPATGSLRMANAGHPPPLLRGTDGSTTFLDGAVSTPLGIVGGDDREEWEGTVEPGVTLVLYSDGLVEDREVPLDVGLERLRVVVATAGDDVEALCDAVLAGVPAEQRSDDTALLVVRAP